MAGKRATRDQQAPQSTPVPVTAEPQPSQQGDPEPKPPQPPQQGGPEPQPPQDEVEEIEVLADDADAVDAYDDGYGEGDEDGDGDGDDEDDEGVFGEALFDPVMLTQQVTQLLVTEDGVPVVDVLQGINDSLDKQNKILYKLVSVIEAHTKHRK